MSLVGEKTFVGFGLGAIQSGLFLYEAFTSGNFRRLVVAEVVPEVVKQVCENGGFLTINIAHHDRVEAVRFGPVEIYNPSVEIDRDRLVDLLADAHEIATAVPGIRYYASPGAGSLCHILANGMRAKLSRGGPAAVLYAAENHNHAAEILEELVLAEMHSSYFAELTRRVRFLNTVIGKMSGVIIGNPEIAQLNLIPMTPDSDRAFLVEAFNQIFITRISFPDQDVSKNFQRGINSFIEKDDLLPFEEAKLFGHNATHALAAYMGALLGVRRIAEVPEVRGLMDFLRAAFIAESGRALINRYTGIDPLFTPEGYAAYADDLLARMVNPWLADTVERVGRDIERKLGWDDRLVGTLRLCIAEGVEPRRFALGTSAALLALDPRSLNPAFASKESLLRLWGESQRDRDQEKQVLELIFESLGRIRGWYREGKKNTHILLGGG